MADKELCPQCKSEDTEITSVDGETWWVCLHQGCDGRVSGARFFWRPGEGLPPKEQKKAAEG